MTAASETTMRCDKCDRLAVVSYSGNGRTYTHWCAVHDPLKRLAGLVLRKIGRA